MSDMMVLGELLEEHRKLKAAVDQFGAKLEAVYGFTNETNVAVKDILSGRQISEWIADLEASGTASNTYSDDDRMNALINDADACKNNNITQLIFDWGVLNNKADEKERAARPCRGGRYRDCHSLVAGRYIQRICKCERTNQGLYAE